MVLSEENVNILYEEAKNSLLNDGNYKEDVKEEVSASICNIVLLHENIITLHNDLLENGNMEEFLSKFYGYIVRNANVYFETVRKSTQSLLLKKIGDKLIYFYKKGIVSSQELEVPTISTITSDDMEGLEYLSGYVISKFLKKYERTVFSDLIHSLQFASDDTDFNSYTKSWWSHHICSNDA